MVLTAIFATAGTLGAGATGWMANATYFNKDNETAIKKWTAVCAIIGGLSGGAVGYGLDSLFKAVSTSEENAAVYSIESTKAPMNEVSSKLIIS